MFSKNRLIGLAVMAFIISVWAMAWPVSKALPGGAFSEPVGSVYNGLNVLFTALAFGGVIITLLFQAEEAKHARREEIERSIFDLFQTFTSQEFQEVKKRISCPAGWRTERGVRAFSSQSTIRRGPIAFSGNSHSNPARTR